MEDKKSYFFDNPKNITLVLYLLYSCCTILFILDFIVHRHFILRSVRFRRLRDHGYYCQVDENFFDAG